MNLEKENSTCYILSGLNLGKDEHQEIKTQINHLAPNCKSYQKIKNVLENDSTGVYQGKIFVKDIAQKTDAYQLSKALILDDRAEFNAKPELEIYADDVKCSHGSASGSLDEDSIFYLMSRGLDKKTAKELLINGFLLDVVEKITDEEIKKLLKNKKAGVILDQISWFEKNSIQIHAQIVVCPDINDGDILEKSILELAEFYKKTSQTVLSVAIVPVGLTKFRPENDGLKSISPEYAKKTIKQVERIQASLQITLGTRFCWLADEWYLIAGTNLPSYKTYENMPQESNGVGTIRNFLEALKEKTQNLPQKVKSQKS